MCNKEVRVQLCEDFGLMKCIRVTDVLERKSDVFFVKVWSPVLSPALSHKYHVYLCHVISNLPTKVENKFLNFFSKIKKPLLKPLSLLDPFHQTLLFALVEKGAHVNARFVCTLWTSQPQLRREDFAGW